MAMRAILIKARRAVAADDRCVCVGSVSTGDCPCRGGRVVQPKVAQAAERNEPKQNCSDSQRSFPVHSPFTLSVLASTVRAHRCCTKSYVNVCTYVCTSTTRRRPLPAARWLCSPWNGMFCCCYHSSVLLIRFASSPPVSLPSSFCSLGRTVPPDGSAGLFLQLPSSSKCSCTFSAVIHPPLPGNGGGRPFVSAPPEAPIPC